MGVTQHQEPNYDLNCVGVTFMLLWLLFWNNC